LGVFTHIPAAKNIIMSISLTGEETAMKIAEGLKYVD
jgi:hypothetical protein